MLGKTGRDRLSLLLATHAFIRAPFWARWPAYVLSEPLSAALVCIVYNREAISRDSNLGWLD